MKTHSICKFIVAVLQIVTGALLSMQAHATPPTLYRQPAHGSPIRGTPDDLLMLPGHGFSSQDRVVYQALGNTTSTPSTPNSVPTTSSDKLGILPVVSVANVPYSLTVRLPDVMASNQSYAIWVITAAGEWSQPIKINDARPLWISPAYVYASAPLASLPRYLKVIGRNLQPAHGTVTQITLIGPQTITLAAIPDERSPSLDHFVARIALPTMTPGNYRIEVNRDATSWVQLAGMMLEVQPDPAPTREYSINSSDFGGCLADDGADDTRCVLQAIKAAKDNGAGTVIFGRGRWDLIDSQQPGLVNGEGIVLPVGVNLRGFGAAVTEIVRHPQWNSLSPTTAFTLTGHNEVRFLKFRDAQIYRPADRAGVFFQLGESYERIAVPSASSRIVSDVIIADNTFDKTFIAIADGGLPISRLFVVNNDFGSYRSSLEPAGNRFNMIDKFRVDDSVVAYNTFKPGSFLSLADKSGSIASEIGAGHRVDFSSNTADGSAIDYLYSLDDARGWRAAFFWHMNNSHEQMLVSQNVVLCSGDKIGDGEALAFDNNGNTFAFDNAQYVIAATASSVTVTGPLLATQNQRSVLTDSYYQGHWIQIGSGPGIGQVRKITSYVIDQKKHRISLHVDPAWDVTPVPQQTRLSVGREFWQVYVVANTIDNRQPLCLKSNRSAQKGGGISLWAQIADSAVESNVQYDSDGITFQNQSSGFDPQCADCNRGTHYVNFVEIRNNTIDGEYNWNNECSSSGISGSLAAAPGTVPQTVTYGLDIAHNTIRQADAQRGGAIALTSSWYQGPAPHRWPLVNNTLIQHNVIGGLWSARARDCGAAKALQRTAINLSGSSLVWRPVLYANVCSQVPLAISLEGAQQVTKLCKTSMPDACECAK